MNTEELLKDSNALFFTARPEAQRCQVMPYVVNVLVVVVGKGTDS